VRRSRYGDWLGTLWNVESHDCPHCDARTLRLVIVGDAQLAAIEPIVFVEP
jgi:hypothetical protein